MTTSDSGMKHGRWQRERRPAGSRAFYKEHVTDLSPTAICFGDAGRCNRKLQQEEAGRLLGADGFISWCHLDRGGAGHGVLASSNPVNSQNIWLCFHHSECWLETGSAPRLPELQLPVRDKLPAE